MPMNKKIRALALVLVLALALTACTQTPETAPTTQLSKTAKYQVTVLGVDGKPATDGVIVQFMKNGQEVAMQRTDAAGVAVKELDRGDYTVQIMFIDQSKQYFYDAASMTLSAIKTELTVELAYKVEGDAHVLFAQGVDNNAYVIYSGNNFVKLEAGKRSYFLFTPTEAGVYRFSAASDACVVGYYGSPFFVQDMNVGEVVGNAACVTISPSMIGDAGSGTSVLVIGVDNADGKVSETMLKVERVSAYVDTSIPSQVYKTTGSLTSWKLPEGASVERFDLSKPTGHYNLVLDEATGFYHLDSVDGPLVLMCLGEAANKYVKYAASFDTMLQTIGINKYFTDENGNYTHKEDYSQCLLDYIGIRDYATGQYTGGCVDRKTGLYPLTADLMYIVQQHGDYVGWWNLSGNNYLFRDGDGLLDATVNPDIAWLFMCVYTPNP